MGVTVLCCALWAGLTTAPSTSEPAPVVRAILLADLAPAARVSALAPYLNVGMSYRDAERVLGDPLSLLGHGPGFTVGFYYWGPGVGDLSVRFYPDGEVYSISYRGKDREWVELRSDDPVTWPKTTGGHNAKLRKKRRLREQKRLALKAAAGGTPAGTAVAEPKARQ